jgi:CheY-like chemotaxis protein
MAGNQFPILYVEDSEDDVFLLKYAFEQAGVSNTIEVARDGQEGVDMLARVVQNMSGPRATPALSVVLLDLKMPKKTGLEVLQWIRAQPELKRLPVIILSSSNQRSDVERAYDLGANGFLVKPADNATLQDMAKAIKQFWLMHNQLPD